MGFWQLAKRFARPTPRRAVHETEPSSRQPDDALGARLIRYNDLLLLLDPSSVVMDRYMLAAGDWEPEQQNFLVTTTRAVISDPACEAVFLDIGAYFGLYALCMARSGLFRRIIAIEGDRRNYAQLRANVFINALDRQIDCFE